MFELDDREVPLRLSVDAREALELCWRDACLEHGPHTYVLEIEEGCAQVRCSNCRHDPCPDDYELLETAEPIPVTVTYHQETYGGRFDPPEYNVWFKITPRSTDGNLGPVAPDR